MLDFPFYLVSNAGDALAEITNYDYLASKVSIVGKKVG